MRHKEIDDRLILEKKNLREGYLVKVFDSQGKLLGYGELKKPINEGCTFIADEERFYDNEKVWFRQKWIVRYVSPFMLPPFTDQDILREQKFIQDREVVREFYYLMGTWKKLKHILSEPGDND